MNISNSLDGTCSMAELNSVSTSRSLTKVMLKNTIKRECGSGIKTLIYNTTSDSKTFHKSIEKAGFQKVFEYSGNETRQVDSKPKTVTTYMLDLSKFK